ncbi:hypothetical protein GIB67_002084 [Kingdonia uniflora]|uniref:Uncharacterized protein n=1 Tax=Kingdonia uniflora TaxID=39325 RepID=A0A7J7KWD7_9MAGN|nr:hypothetical protein GIB67_002084 [Kingdonia uniflora]
MKKMGFRHFSFTIIIFLLLVPSQGGSDTVLGSNNEVYEIDYRGPETHTFIPPPHRSGDSPWDHHDNVLARHKVQGPRALRVGRNGNTNHG